MRRAEDHVDLGPVVGAAATGPQSRGAVVEAKVVPVPEVPVPPGRHAVPRPIPGGVGAGAREGALVVQVPLRLGQVGPRRVGGQLVPPGLEVVVAGQQRDAREAARGGEGFVVGEDGRVVDGGVEGGLREGLAGERGGLGGGGQNGGDVGGADAGEYARGFLGVVVSAAAAAADRLRDVVPETRGVLGRVGEEAEGGTRLRDQARNDGVFGPGEGVVVDRGAAGALAEDGDARRVAPKAFDVVADPLYGCALVQEGGVLGQARGAGEPEDAEAVAGLCVNMADQESGSERWFRFWM